MNVALPALIVFLTLLPGFVFRAQLKRVERTSLDYSPFGQVVTEAILWAGTLHGIWLIGSYWIFGLYLETSLFFKLLSSEAESQTQSLEIAASDIKQIVTYFSTLLLTSYFLPKGMRWGISRYKLDNIHSPLKSLFRFHEAPWYYLLTGADFKKNQEPDFISISAIVNVAGQPFLYRGILDEFFVDAEGKLDRLVLQEVMRRPLAADKPSGSSEPTITSSRFYRVDGDYFVLRYSEAITLNIQYDKFEDINPENTDTTETMDTELLVVQNSH